MNKIKFLRKATVFILIRCMVFGILFVVNFNGGKVYASDGRLYDTNLGNDGSSLLRPYIIDEPQDLRHLAEQVNSGVSYSGKFFMQIEDIDIGESLWTPIGTYGTVGSSPIPFSGSYFGNRYKITNLKIGTSAFPNSTLGSVGLFGYVKHGYIEGVCLESTAIYSSINIGFIGSIAQVV